MELINRLPALLSPERTAACAATDAVPADGTYLTDGVTLLRVEGTFTAIAGNPLVELEDCRTLEIILCPARRIARLGLLEVTPVS
jgi:hypothetical protein